RRRVDDAHVADLEVAEQAVGVAAGEAVEAAAEAVLRFTLGDQALLDRLQRGGAAGGVRGGGDRRLHFRGDVAAVVERGDAGVGARTRRATWMGALGPGESASRGVAAVRPVAIRLLSGVELSCRPPYAQWWLVTTRPCGETKLAVQPPSETTAPIGCPVRLASC